MLGCNLSGGGRGVYSVRGCEKRSPIEGLKGDILSKGVGVFCLNMKGVFCPKV